MGLKTIIFGNPEDQGMMYRIRVFDHGHHIKTATVKNRGQDRIDLVVKGKDYWFLGEEVKLAFMINPNIPPHYFGNTMEIDFDVRDATQLGDIFDLCPDLVYEINQSFAITQAALKKEAGETIDAKFVDNGIAIPDAVTALTDPEPIVPKEPEKEKTKLEMFAEKIPGAVATANAVNKISEAPHDIKTTVRGINLLNEIRLAEDEKKQDLIKKALDFCSSPENQKSLRWLPKYLHIEPEIMAIISQTELDGVGIIPMYYIKQSAAEISEKMLARPKTPDDWKTTAIWIIGILGTLGLIICGLYFITHPGH